MWAGLVAITVITVILSPSTQAGTYMCQCILSQQTFRLRAGHTITLIMVMVMSLYRSLIATSLHQPPLHQYPLHHHYLHQYLLQVYQNMVRYLDMCTI